MLEHLIKRWLGYWHGEGAENQWAYYRCEGCHRLVTHKRISTGGCECAMSNRIRPARLLMREKARLLLLPWSV